MTGAPTRPVLRWHGVKVPNNPLGRDTAGRDRIVIVPSKGDPAPIPPECSTPIAGTNVTFRLVAETQGPAILVTSPPNDPRRFVVEQEDTNIARFYRHTTAHVSGLVHD